MSLGGVVRRVVCFTTTTSRLVVLRVPRHSLAKRCSSTVTSAAQQPIDWTALRDVFVRADTRSRKTSAYIIPAVESLLDHNAKPVGCNGGPQNSVHLAGRARLGYQPGSAGPLVLVPTRELAVQIALDAQRLTTHRKGFKVQLLAGSADKTRQMKDWMESSRNLVVATPGRLMELLTHELEFRQGFKGCPMLILDETDTLLSMGFRDDIDAIVSFLPPSPLRQTILFSATIPRAVRQLASWIISQDHTFIDATPPVPGLMPGQDEQHLARTEPPVTLNGNYNRIEQFRTLCPTASDQIPTLLKLLEHDRLTHGSRSKVIIFCPTAQMTELLEKLLRSLVQKVLPDNGTQVLRMHWKMKRAERDRVRALFREAGENGPPTMLITSDINTRVLDCSNVTRMIQIGVPCKESVHTHRIRRMARSVGSTKGKESNWPAARADLLLLPWEARYMDWQLTHLPIKLLPISTLNDQLTALTPRQHTLTAGFSQSFLAEAQRHISPVDVRNAAASLLGYYLPLVPPLRLQPHAVLAGVSSWASECFHVSIPTITRLPKKFTEAYEESMQLRKTKGLFADGLRLARPSPLGKAKSKNRSVWEGAVTRKKKPKRWY